MKTMGEAAVEHMPDLLTIKFKHWRFEQEHRLFVRLNDKDKETGLYFFDFGSSDQVKLREVIVGARSQISREQVAEVLGDIAPEAVSRKARLAFRTFDVVRQRRQDLWRPSRRRIGLREPSFEFLVDQALQQQDFTVPRDLIEARDDTRSVRRQQDKSRSENVGRSRSGDRRSEAKKTFKKGASRNKR